MNEITIISYPGSGDKGLLSLSHARSRYMLPLGGRFRVVDFTVRNSRACGAHRTLLVSYQSDPLLDEYISGYNTLEDEESSPEVSQLMLEGSIGTLRRQIEEDSSTLFILYNGDSPSIVDFNEALASFRSQKKQALLYRFVINGRPSMAYKALFVRRKGLLKMLDEMEKGEELPAHVVESLVNRFILKGVDRADIPVTYWQLQSIPDYFAVNRLLVHDPELSRKLFTEKIIESQIKGRGYAFLGPDAQIKKTFISDYCHIDGIVENSIIFPGVRIEKGAEVRDSILLPHVTVGEKAKIYRSLLDESLEERDLPNIGARCRIGSDADNLKSRDYPDTIYKGITLIGHDAQIPEGTRIGGACYVAPSASFSDFEEIPALADGLSITKE